MIIINYYNIVMAGHAPGIMSTYTQALLIIIGNFNSTISLPFIQVLHTMALGGGLALLALTYMSAVIYSSTGAVAVGEPTIVLTYEIIMIILVFVNSINHRIRLIVVSCHQIL